MYAWGGPTKFMRCNRGGIKIDFLAYVIYGQTTKAVLLIIKDLFYRNGLHN